MLEILSFCHSLQWKFDFHWNKNFGLKLDTKKKKLKKELGKKDLTTAEMGPKQVS